MTLKVVDLDILKLNVDAIVNAANIDLIEGGGICGQIFEKSGRNNLKEACKKLSPIKPGQAVITDGFGLNQKFIIHAVGPIYNEVYKEACQKILKNAYKNTLELAKKNKINSIAFPLISAGIYGYPEKEAFFIAKNTIDEFLEENEMDVYLSTYKKDILSLIMGWFEFFICFRYKYLCRKVTQNKLGVYMKIFKSIKNRWEKFLENLAKENKKSFGNEKLDCCSMNKREHK